jgi:hypothetical protein
MDLRHEDVLYGAAYRILFEKFDPRNCVTKLHLDAIDNISVIVANWAEKQDKEIQIAYIKAVKDVRKEAADRFENHERAIAMAMMIKKIPYPPIFDEKTAPPTNVIEMPKRTPLKK